MLRQYFLQLFAEKLTKTPKHGSLFEKLLVLAKSMIFRAFSRNDSLFAQKFTKRPKHGSLLEKLLVLAKSMIFRAPSQNMWSRLDHHWSNVHQQDHRSGCLLKRFIDKMSHFLQLFAEKLTKTPKHGSFLEKLQVLAKWTIFRSFSRNELPFATFCWKVDQNAETWLMKFSGKICKQCLISWKSTRTHRFQQNLQRFRKNYHVFAFRSTFQEKVVKSASFRKKERKIMDFVKSL